MNQPNHWAAFARPGHIVAFRFPMTETDARAKVRPCLIIARRGGVDGPHFTLAYGTATDSAANRGLDITLSNPGEVAAAGLNRPRRFVLARRITVGPDDDRFDRRADGTAILDELPARLRPRLLGLTAFLGDQVSEDHRRGRPPVRVPRPSCRRRMISGRKRGIETVVIDRRCSLA